MRKAFAITMFFYAVSLAAYAGPTLTDTLSGSVKGVTAPNHTYFVRDSITINAGDTLQISAGDSILMLSPEGWIHILGTFICDGSSSDRNVITCPRARGTQPGLWGGIVGDSCTYVEVKFSDISWAGGNNYAGHSYRTFDIYSDYANTTTTVFTDNHVTGTVDDCIGLHGGSASVLRNTLKWVGAPDGDNINIKAGTIGEIAYNVIWSAGGNGIKVNADPTLPRLTNVCIHNNTIVAGGWRRIGELGYGILVDASARAQIYNNIIGDMFGGIEITVAADTTRTVYDDNLFFYSADSLKGTTRYYPSDGVGRPAPHDMLDVSASVLFASYHPYFTNDWLALDGSNNYDVLATSVAVGHGLTPPMPTASNHWGNPFFSNGTVALPGDVDDGALGVSAAAGVENGNPAVATTFGLDQNYPNPFNPSTVIRYQIPTGSYVRVVVFDLLGREVRTLASGQESAGAHAVTFDASALPSGVYLYRVEAGSYSATKKMLLVK